MLMFGLFFLTSVVLIPYFFYPAQIRMHPSNFFNENPEQSYQDHMNLFYAKDTYETICQKNIRLIDLNCFCIIKKLVNSDFS